MFVFPTLCRAQAKLDAADTKAEPSFHALTIVRSVDLICHLWQQYINTAVLPLASSSVTLRREMVVFNNQTVNKMESGANGLLQRVADCMSPLRVLFDRHSQSRHSRRLLVVSAVGKTEKERL